VGALIDTVRGHGYITREPAGIPADILPLPLPAMGMEHEAVMS
jgi:hypothetical protein